VWQFAMTHQARWMYVQLCLWNERISALLRNLQCFNRSAFWQKWLELKKEWRRQLQFVTFHQYNNEDYRMEVCCLFVIQKGSLNILAEESWTRVILILATSISSIRTETMTEPPIENESNINCSLHSSCAHTAL